MRRAARSARLMRFRDLGRDGRLCRVRLAGLRHAPLRHSACLAAVTLRRHRMAQRRLARMHGRTPRRGCMTRKRRRLIFVLAGMGCLGIATALVLNAFDDNLVFFYSPTDLRAEASGHGQAPAHRRPGRNRQPGHVRGRQARSISASPTARPTWPSPMPACCPTCSARARAWSPRASWAPTASSPQPRCWPSTTRTTCRPRSPRR